ncbi:hypothetical protein PAMP_002759 [Pampus punctatissimus]
MTSYCKGGTGSVYKEMRKGQWAAVKKVPGGFMTRYDVEREYEIYMAAKHHNVVKLLEKPMMHFDYMWHIPMEFIFGETLENIIFHPRKSSIQLTPTITGHIITGMCEGLFHLHSNGIVHQDLKPDNIMVENNTYRAVIIDMGFAKFYRDGLNSAKDRGNAAYAAPEILGNPPAERDHRSDVWAMGKIIVELLIRYRIHNMHISPSYIQDILSGNVYCGPVSKMLDGSPIPRASMAQVIGEIRAAGRAVDERQSMSIPSISQRRQPSASAVQSRRHSRDVNDAFSSLFRNLDLPSDVRLPDCVPSTGTIMFDHVRLSGREQGRQTTSIGARFRNGNLTDYWHMIVRNESGQDQPGRDQIDY